MHHSPSYGTILIIIVAALSLVAGLVVVMVTSPDSIRIGSQVQSGTLATPSGPTKTARVAPPSPTATQNTNVSNSPTVTVTADTVTLLPTQIGASITLAPTLTPVPTELPAMTPTLTPTLFPTLAPDAVAIGVIVTQNNSTARLRSLPSLAGKVIAAVPSGDLVQVLGNATKSDDVAWLPVRLNNGLSGWVADALVQPLTTPKP